MQEGPFGADELWLLVAAGLVFLMQAGFLCLEVGLVQTRHATATAMKNTLDWVVVGVAFSLVGFGLMFGASAGGWIGSGPALLGIGVGGRDSLFFLFQLGFAATAATIVSGAIAGRASIVSYLVASSLMALLIYPVFGHWVWGGALTGSPGWLEAIGYRDFAGSSVVHAVGGVVGLVGAWIMGPRLGRFAADGSTRNLDTHSFSLSLLGVTVLWVGWWGFNGGSALAFDGSVGGIIVNTNLAACAGSLVGFAHARRFQANREIEIKLVGGLLSGLVAITACANVVSPLGALAVGASAGVLHNLASEWLLRRARIDDPVGAVPVHAVCGVWGVLCVAIFGRADLLPHDRLTQLGVQALGAGVCVAWAGAVGWLVFQAVRRSVGLRVSPAEERAGIHLGFSGEEEAANSAPTGLDPDELRALLGEAARR
ncbi:MAG: ammonium transporter [Myxococcota bacterium]|nr:ammonium transporter [Myxococcota bacterium]